MNGCALDCYALAVRVWFLLMKRPGIVLLLATALIGCEAERQPLVEPQLIPAESPFEYPVALWDRHVTGEALLLVRVSRDGTVDSVTVSNSSGQPAFDSAAILGARKLQFVPGRIGDRPVDMWTKLPVRFSLDSAAMK